MINLIRKDFALTFKMRSLIVFALYFFLLITLADNLNSDSRYILIITTIAYFLSSETFIYDDKTKSYYVINSLPIKRSDVVISKYLSIIVYIIVAIISVGLAGAFISSTKLISGINLINLKVIKYVILSSFIIMAINFPIYFKYGFRQAKLLNFIIYFTFFTLINAAQSILSLEAVESFITFMAKNSTVINSLSLVMVLIFTIISMLISIKIYDKKDM
ncbi:MAG: ABC-2 transporter permease [Clostridium sp.]|nr:ABC-2 transporter permease [Clostridium sp.]